MKAAGKNNVLSRNAVTRSGALIWLLISVSFPPPEHASALTQETRSARKVDEYSVRLLRSHDEQMRIWPASDELKKEREDARLFVIAYGPRPGSARRHANRVKNYWVEAHGLRPDRVAAVDGGFRADVAVEIWVVPRGAEGPVPTPGGVFSRAAREALKYDEFSLDGWWFSSGYEGEAERLDGFAAALQSDPASRGYVLVSRGTVACETCLRPGTEMTFAAKEKEYLVSKHNISPSRVVIIRAGRVGGGRIQLWVVPGGARLPRAKR